MTGPVAPVSADASIITQPSGVDELASAKDAGSRLAEMPLALPSGTGQPAGKKKKKYKAKSLASRGPTALPKNRGTGFEEYFADPPLTPQEAAEEKSEIYAQDIPFEERIQSCITRFRSRRCLSPQLGRCFDEYLFLGGIDTNPVPFSGVDPRELKGLTPAQRREAAAGNTVHGISAAGDRFYNGDQTHWKIDFKGVVAGFLSCSLLSLTGLQEGHVDDAIGVVENFLRYVLQHDVCPDFEDNVKDALAVCTAAREEWPILLKLDGLLPGRLNLAAAELFSASESTNGTSQELSQPKDTGARAVFYSTFALLDEPEIFAHLCEQKHAVAKEYDCTVKIVKITHPSDTLVERFKTLALGKSRTRVSPVGRIMCKLATIEDDWDHPVTPKPFREKYMTLYFEEKVLACMREGMKMSVTVGELDAGVRFVKTIRQTVPSFYTFLPQSMMRKYKVPRPSERPAPSVNDEDPQAHEFEADDGE